jgi:hypothetical protein
MMRVNAFQENVCPDRNIFGLATHKVYPRTVSPRCAVGSYPTFSPLSRVLGTVFFCGTFCQVSSFVKTRLPVRKYGALCCPDFPPPPCDGSGRAGRRPLQRYNKNGRIADSPHLQVVKSIWKRADEIKEILILPAANKHSF